MPMPKILIVEDEVDITTVLKKRLNDLGFQVVVAQDGYEGTQLAHKEVPDLVILDLMLPVGGGLSVLQNIRMSAQIRDIPVLVLTGIKDAEYKKKVLAAGADIYMEKPYDPQELADNINKLLVK